MKKKLFALSMAVMMSASVAACAPKAAEPTAEDPAKAEGEGEEAKAEPAGDFAGLSIGACIYKYDDTFMTGVRNNMQAQADALGIGLEPVDSMGKQPTQDEQVDAFITKGVSALAINPVDRTAVGPLVEKASAAKLPIVFLNREPDKAIMDSYDKVWYVGAHAEESGTLSGEIVAEFWNANKETADKNGDGKLQYIMVTGEPENQGATLRTEYSVKALKDAGIEVEEIGNDTAMWQKVQATELMKAFITSKGADKIEAVLCNNDDMALGVIEALEAEGYNTGDAAKFVPVVGVDATAAALEAMGNGSLLGTVLNDAKKQATATVNIAANAAAGKEITTDTAGYELTDGKYVWIPYVKVTAENYKDFQ